MNRLIFLIILLAIFYGCTSNPTDTTTNFVLFPLAVGNSWTYKGKLFDSLGNKTKEWTSTTTIVGDTLIDSVKWYYTDSSKFALYAVKSDGIHLKLSFFSYKNTLYYKNPNNKNETYYLWGTENDSVEYRIKMDLIIIDEDNVSYGFYNPKLSERAYMRNGIGIVKTEFYGYKYDNTSYVGLRNELIGYTIK